MHRSTVFLSLFLMVSVFPSGIYADDDRSSASPTPALAQQSTTALNPPGSPACPPSTSWMRQRRYASAFRHPLTPQDVAAREAVNKLGVDRHRFVRVELRDGTSLTGGITRIENEQFFISKGIMGRTRVRYSSLKSAPRPTAAPLEHFENGLRWVGFVAGCIIVAPLIIAFLPLMASGVIQD